MHYLKAGDNNKTHTDTTQATGSVQRSIIYQTPFFKLNREENYAAAWGFLKRIKSINK